MGLGFDIFTEISEGLPLGETFPQSAASALLGFASTVLQTLQK